MAKQYFNFSPDNPLPMFFMWLGLLIIGTLVYAYHDAVFDAPERHARQQTQEKWDRDHFNGWRLQQSYGPRDDLFYDRLEKRTCTLKGYSGHPPCPAQMYYVDGKPQTTGPVDSHLN